MSMRLVQPPDFQAALFCHTELSWIVEHRAALLIFGGGVVTVVLRGSGTPGRPRGTM